ncbi:hypothetical protein B0H11DRAFT_803324 [Mycena galericulata]|nr:hypothetical protein B0H11DRAFT_803324 [Mycena galericulata]
MEMPFAHIDDQVKDVEIVEVTTKNTAENGSTSPEHALINKPHRQPQTFSPTGPLYDSHHIPPPATPMLIPPPLVPGPNLTIEEFCTKFNLDEDVCNRFKSQKFKRTDALQYVELAGLKEMGFMPGEIAELRVAIAVWAQRPVPP